MIDALGRPQSLLLLGGTSDIALAVARAYAGARPVVTLAARPGVRREAAAADLRTAGLEVHEVDFEALDTTSHPDVIGSVAAERDIDVALVAFGVLGDEEEAWTDHGAAVHLAQVNYTAAVSVGVALGAVVRRQGHGSIVALSSVAGERVRRSHLLYRSAHGGGGGVFPRPPR